MLNLFINILFSGTEMQHEKNARELNTMLSPVALREMFL
jgi:hypothetical protein